MLIHAIWNLLKKIGRNAGVSHFLHLYWKKEYDELHFYFKIFRQNVLPFNEKSS